MSRLDTEKLTVEYRERVSHTEPIIPRRYTLTHSDETAELFLVIGLIYAVDKISPMRDEVLGEWTLNRDGFVYNAYLYVDGEFGLVPASVRDEIFRRELPLALEAIKYGDILLFKAHPELLKAPIMVYFISSDPQYNKIEEWGSFSDYTLTGDSTDIEASS